MAARRTDAKGVEAKPTSSEDASLRPDPVVGAFVVLMSTMFVGLLGWIVLVSVR